MNRRVDSSDLGEDGGEAKGAGREDFGTQAALALKEFFGAGGEGLVHPVARRAFASAEEADALDLKLLADQRV